MYVPQSHIDLLANTPTNKAASSVKSKMGLGAVIEQDGYVIAHAS